MTRPGPGRRTGHRTRRDDRAAAYAITLIVALLGCRPSPNVVAREDDREVCNGVDDDGNGIVDDRDANGDGLCDCLRIGVLGYPGRWGSIDLIRGWMGARAVPTALLAGQALTPELLAGLDVVIVQDVRDGVSSGTVGQEGVGLGIGRTYSSAEVTALEAWVRGGGGLMTLTGFSVNAGEVTNVNRLLAPFGLSYGSVQILSGSGAPIPVTHWDGVHPIAAGITQVGVENAYPIAGAGTLLAWAATDGSSDLGRALEPGRGRVFAWADEWIEYDVEWSDPAFQVQRLWLNALRWLTPAGRCQVPAPA